MFGEAAPRLQLVAFSPDMKPLASGSGDVNIRVYVLWEAAPRLQGTTYDAKGFVNC